MKRTLALKKETLTELSPGDLGRIVGGTTPVTRTCALLTFFPCYVIQTVVDGCLG
jgi:hypothetical protein